MIDEVRALKRDMDTVMTVFVPEEETAETSLVKVLERNEQLRRENKELTIGTYILAGLLLLMLLARR